MRKLRRFLPVILMLLLSLGISVTVSAAGAPGALKNLKSYSAETTVKLTWSKASKATQYYILLKEEASDSFEHVATTKKTSHTFKNLTPGLTYTYEVVPVNGSGEGTGKTVKAKPQVKKVTAPKGIQRRKVGAKSVSIYWSTVKGATGYEIHKLNKETAEYEKVASTKSTSYTIGNLTPNEKATFKVRSYRKVKGVTRYSGFSKVVSGTPTGTTASPSKNKKVNLNSRTDVREVYYTATVKRDVTVQNLTTGKNIKLKKGTSIIACSKNKSGGMINAVYKNTQKIRIKASNLTYTNFYYKPNLHYTKKAVENYVNQKRFKSPSKYLIWINHYSMKTYIFQGSQCNWKLIKEWSCGVGTFSEPTPLGTYKILGRNNYLGNYALYWIWSTRLNAGNYFHIHLGSSTPRPVSGGCVRLSESQLRFMYQNIPNGTTVISR